VCLYLCGHFGSSVVVDARSKHNFPPVELRIPVLLTGVVVHTLQGSTATSMVWEGNGSGIIACDGMVAQVMGFGPWNYLDEYSTGCLRWTKKTPASVPHAATMGASRIKQDHLKWMCPVCASESGKLWGRNIDGFVCHWIGPKTERPSQHQQYRDQQVQSWQGSSSSQSWQQQRAPAAAASSGSQRYWDSAGDSTTGTTNHWRHPSPAMGQDAVGVKYLDFEGMQEQLASTKESHTQLQISVDELKRDKGATAKVIEDLTNDVKELQAEVASWRKRN
jgi:hypothetical protein